MNIQKAKITDANVLTKLTMQSKAHWGYAAEQIEKWKEDLIITPAYIEQNEVYNLIVDGNIVGYYAFLKRNQRQVKLDNIFIAPEYIGQGYGKILMDHLFEVVRKLGVEKVVLYSDPNAEQFYLKLGFKVVGKIGTSIPGRFMPVMEREVG